MPCYCAFLLLSGLSFHVKLIGEHWSCMNWRSLGHWHLFKNRYRFFPKEGKHLLPLPLFSIWKHHNIKPKKGFWKVGTTGCPLRSCRLLAGGGVRQVVSVALGWQEADKGGWKANVCVKFWSFYSCAAPCRSWGVNTVTESRIRGEMIQASFVAVKETCAVEKSTTCWVRLHSCFLATEANILKPQFSACKAEVEAHYRSPQAASAYVGSLEALNCRQELSGGWQRSSPCFAREPGTQRETAAVQSKRNKRWF